MTGKASGPRLMVVTPAPDRPRQDQLARILRSAAFQHADRLKRFLTFVVTEAIAGRQTELKEYVIGVQVFRKEESFDPRTDPIVRVQARRLRAKLAHYYRDEGRADTLIIDLPKGGYAPVFRTRSAEEPTHAHAAVGGRLRVSVDRFSDRSGVAEVRAACDAIRDEVIHRLAQLTGVQVLAGKSEPSAPAAVIGGALRVASGHVRATVFLVEPESQSYRWSESVDVDVADVASLDHTIACLVVRRLEADAAAPERHQGGLNLAAQNLYLQGRYHLNQRTEEGLAKAVEFFEKALAEGADFAPAVSGLADAYGLLAHYGALGRREAWPKAKRYAERSVELDDRCAEAHTSLAHVLATHDFAWEASEREFRRAIALNPSYATARHWYACSCLAPLGRLDEALHEVTQAQALDPVSSIVARDVAMVHFYRRDFQIALEHIDHAIELNPHFAPAYWLLGLIQEQRGELDESLAAFERAVTLSPMAPRLYGAIGRAHAVAGHRKAALEVLARLTASAKTRYVSPLEFAWVHFGLGRDDLGFKWLAKAAGDRTFDLIAIKVDPRFDPFRTDARFKRIVAKLGVD